MAAFPQIWKNAWEVRISVIISLVIQIALFCLAPVRRRNPSRALNFLIWSMYLLADWVAIFTLGHLSSLVELNGNVKDSYNNCILAFWAPFLLLHLGGPDTITAFSIEDNKLWPRHLIGLLFQVGTALYVFSLSFPNNKLLIPTLLIFVVGLIKYGERTYALYCASFDVLRQHCYNSHFFSERLKRLNPTNVNLLQRSYLLFGEFKGRIVDVPIQLSTSNLKGAELFQIVEYQLGFLYDVLFTKAALIHTSVGYVLRAICSCLIMAAFFSFFFLSNDRFSEKDVAITYTLLGGAICLDALAFVMLIISNWTVVKLLKGELLELPPQIKWSELIAQYDMLKACLPQHQSYFTRISNRPSFFGKLDEILCIQRMFNFLGVDTRFEELRNTEFEACTTKLADLILNFSNSVEPSTYSSLRGRGALDKKEWLQKLSYTVETEYGKSILLWHIATTICYYTDETAGTTTLTYHRRLGKLISDYMMYLSMMRPSMVPSVTPRWQTLYGAICRHYKNLNILKKMRIEEEMPLEELQKEACNILLSNFDDVIEAALINCGQQSPMEARLIDLEARKLAKIVKNWKYMNDGRRSIGFGLRFYSMLQLSVQAMVMLKLSAEEENFLPSFG